MATDTKMLGMTVKAGMTIKKEKQKQRMATDTKIFGMRATKLRFCAFAK